MINDPSGAMVDPPDDLDTLRVPFIFVPRGDPLPAQWIAEHPDYFTVPAVMVPRNPDGSRRPWPEIQALLRQTDAAWGTGAAPPPDAPIRTEAPRPSGSFAPPPAREKRMRGGQPWPKDRNGGAWPAVGDGKCVTLVKRASGAPSPASSWRRGAPVRDNRDIGPGTAIATFDDDGHYANHTDGTSRAAI